MNEHPLLCTDSVVQNFLNGTQTQDRRPVKMRDMDATRVVPDLLGQNVWYIDGDPARSVRSPFGVAGDRLWVREAHRLWFPTCPNGEPLGSGWKVRYRADMRQRWTKIGWDEGDQYMSPEDAGVDTEPAPWRPSIHMPRFACRLTLRVQRVWVHRVQEISEADATAEGVEKLSNMGRHGAWRCYGDCECHKTGHGMRTSATASFMSLWESLYPGSWDRNDWVWACEVEREGTPDE